MNKNKNLLQSSTFVLLLLLNEITAHNPCSGRWAYVCEGAKRSLGVGQRSSNTDSVDGPQRAGSDVIYAGGERVGVQRDYNEKTDWMSSLMARRTRSQTVGSVDDTGPRHVDETLHSLPVFDEDLDDEYSNRNANRQLQLQELARMMLAGRDQRKNRRLDGQQPTQSINRKYNGENAVGRSILLELLTGVRQKQEDVTSDNAAVRKRLLSR